MPVTISTQQSEPRVRRIRAADLRRATSVYRQICVEGTDVVALLDLEFLIAQTARAARTAEVDLRVEGRVCSSTVRYIGTPSGLAGLIFDIGAARVADGVTLIALDGDKSNELLVSETLPILLRDGIVDDDTAGRLRAASTAPPAR